MITKTYTVPASTVRRNDVVNGRTVTTNKTGTKWTELRDESGALIMRVEASSDVNVDRLEKSDEEKRADLIEYVTESLTKELHEQVASSPLASLNEKVAEREAQLAKRKGAGVLLEEVDHWMLDQLLHAQAVRKVYLHVHHWVVDNGDDIITAFARVLAEGRYRAAEYNGDPLSRSTSVTSNMYDDLDRWAYAEVARGLRWNGAGSLINERIAELTKEA